MIQTRALRADGTFVYRAFDPTVPILQRTIYAADGKVIEINDVGESRSSTLRDLVNSQIVSRRDPASNCLTTFLGRAASTGERLVGEEVLDGLKVIATVSPNRRAWYAPLLSCELVKLRVNVLNGSPIESFPTTVAEGEPDLALFDVPARYAELPPSLFQGLSKGSAQAQSLDSYYYAHRVK
jgi:hypothetical protein